LDPSALAPIVINDPVADASPMATGSPRHDSLIVVLLLCALGGAHLPLRWIMQDPAAISWSPAESIVSDAPIPGDASILRDVAIPAAVRPSIRPPAAPGDVTVATCAASFLTSSPDCSSILRI